MQKILLIVYLLCQLIYCVVVTFTVTSLLFALSVRDHVNSFMSLGTVQLKFLDLANETVALLEQHSVGELQRQTKLVNSMQKSCDNYIEDLAKVFSEKLDQFLRLEQLEELLNRSSSWTGQVLQKFNTTISGFQQEVESFIRQYNLQKEQTLRPVLSNYKSYIQKIQENSWLMYPQSIFNKTSWLSNADSGTLHKSIHHGWHHLLKDEAALSSFLNFEEVEIVNSWQSHFAQRLHHDLESLMSSVDFVWPEYSSCNLVSAKVSHKSVLGNKTAHAQMDSYKYSMTDMVNETSVSWIKTLLNILAMTSSPLKPPDYVETPFDGLSELGDGEMKNHHSAEEIYDDILSAYSENPQNQSVELQEGLDDVSWNILKLIFLVLDAIILVFRFSHICLNVQKMCSGFEEVITLKLADVECTHLAPVSRPSKSELPKLINIWQNHCNQIQKVSDDSVHEIPDISSCVDGLKTSSTVSGMISVPNHHHPSENLISSENQNHGTLEKLFPLTRRISSTTFLKTSMMKSASAHQKIKNSYSCKDCLKCFWHGLNAIDMMPALIASVFLLLMFWLALKLSFHLLHPNFQLSINGVFGLVLTLASHVNATNKYLSAVADAHSADLSQCYLSHAVHELSNLQGLIEYHFTGFSYRNDHKSSEGSQGRRNSTCDNTYGSTHWQLPVLPCSFIPIQARLYTECRQETRWQELVQEYTSILRSSYLLLAAFFHLVLLVLAVITAASAIQKLFFHCIRTRQLFPLHFLYVTTTLQMQETNSPKTKTVSNNTVVSILPGQSTGNKIQTVYCESAPAESSLDLCQSTSKHEFPISLFSETKV